MGFSKQPKCGLSPAWCFQQTSVRGDAEFTGQSEEEPESHVGGAFFWFQLKENKASVAYFYFTADRVTRAPCLNKDYTKGKTFCDPCVMIVLFIM